jgi:hypothetical protein
MRVRAIFQFYLDYVLPRLEDGVDVGVIGLNAPGFQVYLKPKGLDEPMFPNEIDLTLSAMRLQLKRADGAEGEINFAVALSCVDRIQVVLEWGIDDEKIVGDEDVKLAMRMAVEAANHYLEHCRYVSASPFVSRIARFWRPQDGEFYIGVPYTTSWFNLDADSAALPVFNGVNAEAGSSSVRSPESGVMSIDELYASMQTGVEPPLHKSLLVDADGYIQALALREAALSLASSCEIAAQFLIERCGGNNDARVRPVLGLRGVSFAERYYNKLPQAVGEEKFVDRSRSSFELLEEMYRQRNSLIHRGVFKENVYMLGRPERQAVLHSWLLAAREAVDWIDGILPNV